VAILPETDLQDLIMKLALAEKNSDFTDQCEKYEMAAG
jgi:hypothetical protein